MLLYYIIVSTNYLNIFFVNATQMSYHLILRQCHYHYKKTTTAYILLAFKIREIGIESFAFIHLFNHLQPDKNSHLSRMSQCIGR